ncbi:MAG: helical backbone metal receptor [Syntrophales bacterium]|nr:helical backbone metal receptor [Syntrophales bacterium]
MNSNKHRTTPYPVIFLLVSFCNVFFFLTYTEANAAPPKRIVSLAPNITEILFSLGLGERVVAVTTFCDYPQEALKKPKVGGFSNPSIEAIVAAKPDLVIMTDDGNPLHIAIKLHQLGIRTYVFRARKIKELPEAIRALGKYLEVPKVANERADELQRKLNKFQGKRLKDKILAMFVVQPDPLIVAGPNTLIGEAMDMLGLENIAANTTQFYPKLSLEEVMNRQPQIIFVGQSKGMEEDIQNLLSRLKKLPAVQMGKVYIIRDTIFRLGPRITIGLEEMNAAIAKSKTVF